MSKFSILLIANANLDCSGLISLAQNMGHEISVQSNEEIALDYIEKNKPNFTINFEEFDNFNAQEFIVKASQRKVFNHTSFMLLCNNYDLVNKQNMYMTLGYFYFGKDILDSENLDIIKSAINEEIKFKNTNVAA